MIQATGGIATTIGVLTALYIAVIREPRQASEEHRHHMAQLAAAERVKREQAGAHARKLVPACERAPILGDRWWTVRIDNASAAATIIHSVAVTAVDTNGIEVRGGVQAADNARLALSERLGSRLQAPQSGVLEQVVQTAVTDHFVKDWPRSLPSHRHAVMAYTATDPSFRLHVTVEYEDDEGFQWRRTDTGEPLGIGAMADRAIDS